MSSLPPKAGILRYEWNVRFCHAKKDERALYRALILGKNVLMNRKQRRAAAKLGGTRGDFGAGTNVVSGTDVVQTKKPATLQAKFQQGLALHQQARFAEAERAYEEVLRQEPRHFDALHLLGIIALQTRRTQRGIELIAKAI